ncbi:MAG: hypothetical protein AB8G26_09805 [Ilumatobacter sp.]
MTILENPSDTGAHQEHAERLDHLERTVAALWSAPPACTEDERFELVTRLSSVASTLERVRRDGELNPSSGFDAAALLECVSKLATLSSEWCGLRQVDAA